MADDIDIEEHDILANPRVQSILPVIQNIKSEPVDFDDGMEEYEYAGSSNRLQFEEQNEEHEYRYDDDDMEEEDLPCFDTVIGNKIIFGSKPTPEIKYELQVTLEDWGEKLMNNPCYCKDCKTLFATRNAVDAHKMAVHSFLVAIDVPIEEPTRKQKFCDHCKTYFEYNKFIQHLYDLIYEKQKQRDKPKRKDAPMLKLSAVKQLKYNVCTVCSCHFRFVTNMTRHCLKNHSIKFKQGEPVPFSKKCEHCSSAIANTKYLNKHIRFQHPHLWKMHGGNVKKAPSKIGDKNSSPKLKCYLCNKLFSVHTALRKHMFNVHNIKKFVTKQIVGTKVSQDSKKVVVSKKVLIPNKQAKKTLANFIHERNSFVPKNVLFKCDSCPTHFVNCVSGITHASRDHRNDSQWVKCDKCKRAFRAKDMQLHELQHRSVDKFKVFVIHDNIYARVLCKCPGCCIYFEERALQKHCKDGYCGETVHAAPCHICRTNINNLPSHKLKHTEKNFLKTDFIWVDDYIEVDNYINPLKRKIQIDEEPAKKPKLEVIAPQQKVTFYYCPNCKCFTKWSYDRQFHTSKQCRAFRKKPCSFCGLLFLQDRDMKAHKHMHRVKNYELENFRFAYLSNTKPMTPGMTEFPLCVKCQIHYIDLRGHGCNMYSWKNCGLCDKKFSLQAYDLHMLHHKYFQKLSIELSLKTIYEKLKPTWDILYKCTICDVMTDTYDIVIDHCQKHYNNVENYDVAILNCDICEMNFDEKSYERHAVLHGNQDIKSDRFTIINYEYYYLLTHDWYKVLSPLPEELQIQIQEQSIYVTRQVKMFIECKGPADKTLYKCNTCNLIVPSNQVLEHTRHSDNCTGNGFKCSQCSLSFTSPTARDKHEKRHNNSDDALVSGYRIVAFNSPSDKEFNLTLFSNAVAGITGPKLKCYRAPPKRLGKSVEEIPLKTLNELRNVTTKDITDEKKFTYYQCQLCTCCCTYTTSITHKCFPQKDIRTCDLCSYNFTYRSIFQHKGTHEKAGALLTQKNIRIIPFNNDVKRAIIYMCSCGLHFLAEDQIKEHFPVCSPNDTLHAVKCSKCGKMFPPDLLVKHLNEHHKPGVGVEIKSAITYFKCGACGCHFKKRMALCNHQRVCYGKTKSEQCKMCHLTFSNLVLSQHQLTCTENATTLHHITVINATRAKLSTNQSFEEKNVTSENDDTLDSTDFNTQLDSLDTTPTRLNIKTKRIINNALYKCTDCNCYFNSTTTIGQHMQNYINTGQSNCQEFVKPVLCSECNLHFNDRSLSRHIAWHNKHKFDMKDVLVYVLDRSNPRYLVLQNSLAETKPQDESQDTSENVEDKDETVVDEPEADEVKDKQDDPIKDAFSKDCPIEENAPIMEDYFSAMAKIKMLKRQDKSVLYKCSKCEICFLTHATLQFHYERNHIVHYKPHLCRMCGLTFPLMTMGRHRALHHKNKYYDNTNLCVVTVGEAHAKKFLSVKQLDGANIELNDNDSQVPGLVKEKASKIEPRDDEAIVEGPDETAADEEDESSDSEIDLTVKLKELQKAKTLLLFKCVKCDLYYMNQATLATHAEYNRHILNFPPKNCNICGLKFTSFSMERHKKVHHPNNKFEKEIIYVVESNPKDHRDIISIKTLADYKDLGSPDSIVSQSSNDPATPMSSTKQVVTTPSTARYNHKLYKCGLCNVYFLSQNTCYKHILYHEPMDARDYIDCKFCNFPFRIASLSTHVRMHHASEFELDKVLVEEYSPGEDKKPKIDIYCAIDKVQSRLVSTTTDEKHESPSQSLQINDKNNGKQDTEVTNEIPAHETRISLEDDNCKGTIVLDQVLDSVTEPEMAESEKSTDTNDELAKQMTDSENAVTSLDPVKNIAKENSVNTDCIGLDSIKTELEDKPDIEDTADINSFKEIDSQPVITENTDGNGLTSAENTSRDVNDAQIISVKNEIKTEENDSTTAKPTLKCSYCDETFSNNMSKLCHESLDHLDGKKECPICHENLNASILNEMHLNVEGDFFSCCICKDNFNKDLMITHSKVHA